MVEWAYLNFALSLFYYLYWFINNKWSTLSCNACKFAIPHCNTSKSVQNRFKYLRVLRCAARDRLVHCLQFHLIMHAIDCWYQTVYHIVRLCHCRHDFWLNFFSSRVWMLSSTRQCVCVCEFMSGFKFKQFRQTTSHNFYEFLILSTHFVVVFSQFQHIHTHTNTQWIDNEFAIICVLFTA